MNQTTVGSPAEPQNMESIVQVPFGLQMAVFLEKLDSDLEQRRQAFALEEARLVEKKALCAAFPETVPMAPCSVTITPNGYLAEAELVFDITTREEVLQLLDAFPGLPVIMLRGGCTSFIAEERFTSAEPGTTAVPIGAVVYRLSDWVDAPQEEYTWWTHLAGKLVHVLAKTKKGHRVCAKVTSSTRMLSPSLQEINYSYANLPDGAILTWYGGGLRSMVPVSVHQPRGGSFRDAVAKPMVTTAKTTARRCEC